MIPKIIHLCWFGKSEYPPLVKMCIESWNKVLPDYRIMIWNEDTFDVNSSIWTRQAYQTKKWAFVSDYVRLYALYKYGGIYLDTDVEVLKRFDDLLLAERIVLSRIEGGLISCGFIACPKNNKDIFSLLSFYERDLINNDGSIKLLMNPLLFTMYFHKEYNCSVGYEGFEKNDTICVLPLHVLMPFRKSFFGGKKSKYSIKKYIIKEDCRCIHHDLGSWGKKKPILTFFKHLMRLILPSSFYLFLKKKRAKKMVYDLIKTNTFIF